MENKQKKVDITKYFQCSICKTIFDIYERISKLVPNQASSPKYVCISCLKSQQNNQDTFIQPLSPKNRNMFYTINSLLNTSKQKLDQIQKVKRFLNNKAKLKENTIQKQPSEGQIYQQNSLQNKQPSDNKYLNTQTKILKQIQIQNNFQIKDMESKNQKLLKYQTLQEKEEEELEILSRPLDLKKSISDYTNTKLNKLQVCHECVEEENEDDDDEDLKQFEKEIKQQIPKTMKNLRLKKYASEKTCFKPHKLQLRQNQSEDSDEKTVVCLDCKIKISQNSALYGKHTYHNTIQESQVKQYLRQEILNKKEQENKSSTPLINSENSEQEALNFIQKQYEENVQQIQKEFNVICPLLIFLRFQNLRNFINEQEMQKINNLKTIYEQFKSKIKDVHQNPSEFNGKPNQEIIQQTFNYNYNLLRTQYQQNVKKIFSNETNRETESQLIEEYKSNLMQKFMDQKINLSDYQKSLENLKKNPFKIFKNQRKLKQQAYYNNHIETVHNKQKTKLDRLKVLLENASNIKLVFNRNYEEKLKDLCNINFNKSNTQQKQRFAKEMNPTIQYLNNQLNNLTVDEASEIQLSQDNLFIKNKETKYLNFSINDEAFKKTPGFQDSVLQKNHSINESEFNYMINKSINEQKARDQQITSKIEQSKNINNKGFFSENYLFPSKEYEIQRIDSFQKPKQSSNPQLNSIENLQLQKQLSSQYFPATESELFPFLQSEFDRDMKQLQIPSLNKQNSSINFELFNQYLQQKQPSKNSNNDSHLQSVLNELDNHIPEQVDSYSHSESSNLIELNQNKGIKKKSSKGSNID